MLQRIPGAVLLWLSVVLFAASNSIVRILSDLGAENLIDGRNAISFCNLLFAGNACAVVALLAVYHKHWTMENLRKLSRADWLGMFALALLTSCIGPWFFFIAIENTMVTSVVLLAQIDPPLVLLLSWLIYGERFSLWSGLGAALCVTGVALSVLLQPGGVDVMLGKGELYAAAAAVIYAVSTIIARPRMEIPLGIFTVFRNAVGTVFFFIAASILYGPAHFQDLTAPFLWKWMAVYGGIIIVGGQVLWFTGLGKVRSIDVSLATSASPIAGVLGAFLILGERPMSAQLIGGAVLLGGIAFGLLGSRGRQAREEPAAAPAENAPAVVDAECRAGFRGV